VLQFCTVAGLAVSLLRAVRIQCGGWPRTPPQSYAQYTAAFQFKLKRKKNLWEPQQPARAARAIAESKVKRLHIAKTSNFFASGSKQRIFFHSSRH
jgi:hypothetical protein